MIEPSSRRLNWPWLFVLAFFLVAAGIIAFVAADRSTTIQSSSVQISSIPTISANPASLQTVADAALSRVVTVETQATDHEELGTGWLLDSGGDFATNAHVVAGALTIRIRDRAGNAHVATVMGIDREQDIAVVRSTDGFYGPPLAVENNSSIDAGIPVAILASRKATEHDGSPGVEVTTADIVDLHRDVPASSGDLDPGTQATTVIYHDMLMMSAQVFRGNSGGPVLDGNGQVIGILTLASKSQAESFAIPITRVQAELAAFAARSAPLASPA